MLVISIQGRLFPICFVLVRYITYNYMKYEAIGNHEFDQLCGYIVANRCIWQILPFVISNVFL